MSKGNCSWCTGSFEGLSEVYRRKSTQLEFCTINCLEDYEKYQHEHKRSRWYLAAAGILGLFILVYATTPKAQAQEQAEHHHPLHEEFYSKWKVPGQPNASCCNARIETNGRETGDCEPSQAEIRNGDWFVYIRQLKRWIPVEDSKIIHEPNPNIYDAHVCWTPPRGIICFKPPDTGG